MFIAVSVFTIAANRSSSIYARRPLTLKTPLASTVFTRIVMYIKKSQFFTTHFGLNEIVSEVGVCDTEAPRPGDITNASSSEVAKKRSGPAGEEKNKQINEKSENKTAKKLFAGTRTSSSSADEHIVRAIWRSTRRKPGGQKLIYTFFISLACTWIRR